MGSAACRQHAGKDGCWSDIPGRRQSSTSDKLRRHTTSHSKASSAHARLHVDAGALKERRAGSECWSWRPVTCGQRMEPGVKAHLLVWQEHISTLAHIILPSVIPVGHNSGRRGDDQPARHEGRGLKGARAICMTTAWPCRKLLRSSAQERSAHGHGHASEYLKNVIESKVLTQTDPTFVTFATKSARSKP